MRVDDPLHLYSDAILMAIDRLRAAGDISPQHQAAFCRAIQRSVEEAFCQAELQAHTHGFLERLSERTHAALAAEEARLRFQEGTPRPWMAPGDE